MTTSPIVIVIVMVNYWFHMVGRKDRRRNLSRIMGINLRQVASTTRLANPSLVKLIPTIPSAREKMRTYSTVMVIITTRGVTGGEMKRNETCGRKNLRIGFVAAISLAAIQIGVGTRVKLAQKVSVVRVSSFWRRVDPRSSVGASSAASVGSIVTTAIEAGIKTWDAISKRSSPTSKNECQTYQSQDLSARLESQGLAFVEQLIPPVVQVVPG